MTALAFARLAEVVKISGEYRDQLQTALNRYLSSEETSLVMGLVFGGSTQLSADMVDTLKVIGMLHIVSASGYNLNLVLSCLQQLLVGVNSRKLRTFGACLALFCYLIIAGGAPSLLRAFVMVIFGQISYVTYRQTSLNFTLFLTVVCLYIAFSSLRSSLSFWLSVGSTAGLIYFAPRASIPENKAQQGMLQRLFNLIKEGMLLSLASQVFIWPLLLYKFGEWSWFSVIANTSMIMIIPVMSQLAFSLVILASFGFLEILQEPLSVSFALWQQLFGELSEFLSMLGIPPLRHEGISLTNVISWWLFLLLLKRVAWWKQRKRHNLWQYYRNLTETSSNVAKN